MAHALGVSSNYYAQMERGEKEIERRTAIQIDSLVKTRIDVSYSDALEKWVVVITKPGTSFAGRAHYVIAAKPTEHEAREIAQAEWEKTGKFAMLTHRGRD
jgi:hypothetical protein